MKPLLEVKNLQTYFFSEKTVVKAVDDVSFDLKQGETLGLVGESGCGKSVSAMSIMRLIPNPPGEIINGEIWFEGKDLLKLSDEQMRHVRGNRIAMIFQEPMSSLNPVLTIGRQVSEPMEIHRSGLQSEPDHCRRTHDCTGCDGPGPVAGIVEESDPGFQHRPDHHHP
jgi:oligopeptide transport system ATP-binding protein